MQTTTPIHPRLAQLRDRVTEYGIDPNAGPQVRVVLSRRELDLLIASVATATGSLNADDDAEFLDVLDRLFSRLVNAERATYEAASRTAAARRFETPHHEILHREVAQ